MTNREVELLHRKICREVADRKMSIALGNLKQMAEISGNAYMQEQRNEIEETYANLLNFALNGVKDPSQESIYNQTQTKVLELADMLRDSIFTRDSDNIVYRLKRSTSFQFDDIETNYDAEAHFRKLFHKLWLTEKYSTEEIEKISELFSKDDMPTADMAAFVSAVTLSLIRTFDEGKLNLLLDWTNRRDTQIRQRALVGVIFGTNAHAVRIPIYGKIRQRLELSFPTSADVESLQNTILQILICNETDKISEKMKSAIPDFIKQNKMRDGNFKLDELFDDNGKMEEFNPNWDFMASDKFISDKTMELSELQREGGDVFMYSFSTLKNYSFFNYIENWFLPFCKHPSALKHLGQNSSDELCDIIPLMEQSTFLCDSDKYSMLYSITQTPKEYISMLRNTINFEKQQMEDIKKEAGVNIFEQEKQAANKSYLQDLFRFYSLYAGKADFSNPFSTFKEIRNNPLLDYTNYADKILRTICDYFVRKEHYGNALPIAEKLLANNPTDADLLQKAAYCLQQTGAFKEAIPFYEKADCVQPESLWNLKHLAYCEKQVGDYERSLAHYQRAALIGTGDLAIESNIGYCLIRLERYEEALKVFYKLNYMTPDDPKTEKAIGWCSLATGKLDNAAKYYGKTAEADRKESDWLNIGHVQLCQGNREAAIANYQKAYELMSKDKQHFSDVFEGDEGILIKNGIDKETLPLLLDYILVKL